MSKGTSRSARAGRRGLSPVIIIGGTILVLAVAFLAISTFILEKRDPEVARTLAERSSGESPGTKALFRDDGRLTFFSGGEAPAAEISIEIAETEEARTQGLMGRNRMAEQQGMLFVFPTAEYRSFWMANTPLPLDILFVGSDGTIVTIHRDTVPYSEESIPSTAPAQYVIEVNAGFCNRHGIGEGDRVAWSKN